MLETTKKSLIISSIIISIFLIFFAAIVFMCIFTRPIQNKQITKTLVTVLEQKEKGRYKIGQRVFINSAFSDTAYFFEVQDLSNNNADCQYAVLSRIIGLNGPIPVVFLGNETHFEFFGIAGIKNSQQNPITYGITDQIIGYWNKNLTKIIIKSHK
ncbi:MAG: hypothetical protein ACTTHG_00945 [Treponemataceae bacterium]